MSDKAFLDTNVLVYASLKEKEDSQKRERVLALLSSSDTEFVISTQVVNEYYRVLLRNGFSDEDIQKRVDEFLNSSHLVLIFESTIRLSWSMRKKYGFSFLG
jgi:predicted nucleic acid-binding protein